MTNTEGKILFKTGNKVVRDWKANCERGEERRRGRDGWHKRYMRPQGQKKKVLANWQIYIHTDGLANGWTLSSGKRLQTKIYCCVLSCHALLSLYFFSLFSFHFSFLFSSFLFPSLLYCSLLFPCSILFSYLRFSIILSREPAELNRLQR
jgi:hypothetical protein